MIRFNTFARFNNKNLFCFLLIALTNCFAVSAGFAQETSAGSVLQGIKSQEPAIVLPKPEPKLQSTTPAPVKAEGETFALKRIQFIGNTKVSSSILQSLVLGYLNRPIHFNELKQATEIISEYYLDHGWLARVILPEQDISNGIATIKIIEASLGSVLIDNQSKRVSDARVEAWIYAQIPQFSSLSLQSLDRALLTLNDQPDIVINGSLQKGNKPSETIAYLVVTDKPLTNSLVSVDNYGQSSTGENRATANININSPLGMGEQLNIFGLYTEGSSYGRLAVTAPIGSDGLRVGLNASYLTYRVINPAFYQLWANGSSSTGGAEFSYPIIRSRPTNLYLLGNYNYSEFDNRANGGITSRYNTSVFLGGLSGNSLDNFFGGGLNSGLLLFSAGKVTLNTSPSFAYDQIGPQVNGNFSKLRYSGNRIQNITAGLSASLSISGQFANKNLDSSEQLYLGGPYAVRAYATGQGNASQGNLTTIELRQNLSAAIILSGFYDYANVQTYQNTNFVAQPPNNNYVLQGLGASLGWSGPMGVQLKATWAMRTGSLPNSVTQSLNGNGGTSSNRFWLTASLPI